MPKNDSNCQKIGKKIIFKRNSCSTKKSKRSEESTAKTSGGAAMHGEAGRGQGAEAAAEAGTKFEKSMNFKRENLINNLFSLFFYLKFKRSDF
jgi:hypothetical protein